MIQTTIASQRSSKLEIANSKQRDKRRHAANLITDNSNSRPSSPDPALEIEEPVNQSSARKRRAPEDITNISKRRAPRASQPTVAQAFEDFGPKYRTRRRGIVAEAPLASRAGGLGKENNSQPTRSL